MIKDSNKIPPQQPHPPYPQPPCISDAYAHLEDLILTCGHQPRAAAGVQMIALLPKPGELTDR